MWDGLKINILMKVIIPLWGLIFHPPVDGPICGKIAEKWITAPAEIKHWTKQGLGMKKGYWYM